MFTALGYCLTVPAFCAGVAFSIRRYAVPLAEKLDSSEADNRMLSAFCEHALPDELKVKFLEHCRESRERRK